VPDAPPLALLGHHPVAAQDVADGGAAREIPPGVALMHDREEFLAAPGRMPATGFEERRDDLRCGLIGRLPGPSRPCVETCGSEVQVAVDPFVGGLA